MVTAEVPTSATEVMKAVARSGRAGVAVPGDLVPQGRGQAVGPEVCSRRQGQKRDGWEQLPSPVLSVWVS